MSLFGRFSVVRLAGVAVLITLAAVVWLVVIGGGSTARATVTDGDVVLGAFPADSSCTPGTDVNCENSTTEIQNVTSGSDAFIGNATGAGTGIFGSGDSGYGVQGSSVSAAGVFGEALSGSGTGVFGEGASGYGLQGKSSSNFGLFADSTGATGGHIQTESQFGAGLEVQINNANNGRGGIEVQTNGSGQGLLAQAAGGAGVDGSSSSGDGVHALSNTGFALFGDSSQATGGHIQTESLLGAGLEVQINNTNNGRGGIEVQTNGSGQGLLAQAASGAGVEAHSKSGPALLGVANTATASALKTQGKAALSGPTTLAGQSTFTGNTSFARSGKLTVPAGAAQVTKSPLSLSSSSLVLATIQGNQAGVYVQGVTIVAGSSGTFTIHLNTKTPANLPVAWFVLN
jgi:hypothetical protein